MNYNIYFKQNL